MEWAIKNDFAVIDVNIPSHITPENDTGGYVEPDNVELRAAATRELATYLWENYIEVNESANIYLLGIGAAYAGVVWLLSNEERYQDRVVEVIAFVAESSILGVSRPADDGVSAWYYQHSSIFVAANHYFWNPDRPKKQRKRYGSLKQSPHSDLNDMLRAHMPDVEATLKHGMEAWREEVARKEEERLRHESALRDGHLGSASKPAPMVLDGGPMSPVRAHMEPMPMRSPGNKVPPMGMFMVTSSPGRPRSVDSPATGSPSRR